MRSLLTFFGLLLTTSTVVAQTQVIQTILNLNLKVYLCDVSGNSAGLSTTKTIFAANEPDAIKLCLLKARADVILDYKDDGTAVISSVTAEIHGKAVTLDSIKIRGPITAK